MVVTLHHVTKLGPLSSAEVRHAAGLFAHSATVLSFIDHNSHSDFKESLEAVIISIANPGTKPASLHADLDKLYILILQRVPGDILPTALLLLSHIIQYYLQVRGWYIAPFCNILRISEAAFRSVYHHLQAVLTIRNPRLRIDKAVALERSYLDLDLTLEATRSLEDRLLEVHGVLDFHHKSFYDFITDPTRSSNFCVTTLTARQNLFERYVQQHIHYTASYAIQDLRFVQAPDVSTSSTLLSWPKGSELVDSAIQLRSFRDISYNLSHNHPRFGLLVRDLPLGSLHQLAELDYRKCLIADNMVDGLGLRTEVDVVGHDEVGIRSCIDGSVFDCIDKDEYGVFDPAVFLRMVDKLETAGVIRPYDPRLGASRVTSLLHTLSRQKSSGRRCGRFKLGHGDKSVIWYWEFDTEERYFHQFRTANYVQAMGYYKAEKFKIWEWKSAD